MSRVVGQAVKRVTSYPENQQLLGQCCIPLAGKSIYEVKLVSSSLLIIFKPNNFNISELESRETRPSTVG